MSLTKDKVIELIKTLPDDITVDDIMGELYFKSQVDEGLAQLDRGEGIPHEDVEKRMSRWLSQQGGLPRPPINWRPSSNTSPRTLNATRPSSPAGSCRPSGQSRPTP